MYKSQSSFQNSMFGNFAYKHIIERNNDHLLVRLNNTVDLSFIEDIVANCYCHDNGRPAYHPVMMFKILFLQTLYDESDEKIIEAVDTNILFRYFIGLSLEDDIPDRTLLGKFKQRLGEERFNAIFNQIVNLAKQFGLIDNRLRLIDCSAISAQVDLQRCKQHQQDNDDKTFIDRHTSDPEASTGYKSKNSKWYGYKSGIIIDAKSEIVTAVLTTTAKVADTDHLEHLIIKDIIASGGAKRLCGDKGFLGHSQFLKDRHIMDNIIRRNNMKIPKRLIYYTDKKVRPIIEHKFAEAKKYHGLSKTKYRGRWRTHIWSLCIYLTINLKKIVNYLSPIAT